MSINRFKPHLLILPEDRADEMLAHGFLLEPSVAARVVHVEQIANGWSKVLSRFEKELVPWLNQNFTGFVLLLFDFDDKPEVRLNMVRELVPKELADRVFVLGVLSEPEKLRNKVGMPLEKIGLSLAQECTEGKSRLWGDDLLKHNEPELKRMLSIVKPFLFPALSEF